MREFIRRFFRGLLTLLTWPFRMIAKPFIAFRNFINNEPDETPLAEVFATTMEQPSLLIDHIEALRRHILRALIVLSLAVILSMAFTRQILQWLTIPIGGLENLQAIEVTESVGAYMRVALLTGFTIALPYIGIELFAFLNPGLRRRERVTILIVIPIATGLFIAGAAFTYYIMLGPALDFLLTFLGIETAIRPSNYIQFVTGLMFWIGIAFQFPLIIYALAALGIVNARSLIQGWRFAILGIAVVAAAVTPTIDPVNMGLVMLPMIVLYFLSIGMASIATRGRSRRQTQAQRQQGALDS
jgi:sec-independent protein translocase protein TatC